MKQLTLLVKPASSLCNLRCRYCFYQDEAENRQQQSMGLMESGTMEILLRRAMDYIGPGGNLSIVFQGGEPTLAGADFFLAFTETARKLLPPGAGIHYAIQTNGYALSDELIAIWKRWRFLVGISMDGFRLLHDSWRVDAAGNGSWQKVLGNLKKLQKAGIDTNALCVITGQAAKNPEKLYRTLKQLGFRYQQYIPCLDPLECQRGTMPFSLLPEDYGSFLKAVFDLWYADWKRQDYVSIRNFEDYVRNASGLPCGSCGNSGACGHYLLIEADGSAYPCDFYALDQWKLGSILDASVEELMEGPLAQVFRSQREPGPVQCSQCPYAGLCRGGCYRDWEGRSNYYCPAFQAFFSFAGPRLQEMALAEGRSRRG